MNVGNNKLTGFIIIFSFLALGCGRDSYNSNREEFSIDLLVDRTAPVAILTTAIISSSGNAMVQSTETGTVYLVNTMSLSLILPVLQGLRTTSGTVLPSAH